MSDCYSTGNGAMISLRVETTTASFFALPYHQLERVDFISADGTDTVIASFITCTIRIIGKRLHLLAVYLTRQEAESIKVSPKNIPPQPEKTKGLSLEPARIEKIEVVEKKGKIK